MFMKKFQFILPLLIPAAALADGPPPCDDSQLERYKREIEQFCQVTPPPTEDSLHCFIDRAYELKEQAILPEEIARRLIKEGEMRLAFLRGFEEGRRAGSELCKLPPPPPSETPEPRPNEGTKRPNEKVLICHIPSGSIEKARTLSVSSNAVQAHLAHGDTLGKCPEDSSSAERKGGKSSDRNPSSSERSGKKGKATQKAGKR
jgi:hypothetical protein